MSRSRRTIGLIGIGLRQLSYNRTRTILAVVGIVIAVLAVTLLFGVASGVTDTGEELVEDTDRDLWVSGGPIELTPESVGGFQNPIVDSHNLSAEIESHEGVSVAIPIAFNSVYIGTESDSLETIFGTGVSGGGPAISLDDGDGFTGSDTHWADGDYDGPMTHQVLIDPVTAEEYDIEVGDSLFVGGTILDAQQNEFEIVGISSTFSDLSGTQAVTIRLSELQTLTGMAATDRSSLIMVTLEDDADVDAVQADLEEAHPEFEIRTNREQVTEVLENQVLLVVGGLSLVGLAVMAGLFFSLNLFLSLVYQQRREFGIFRALGGSFGSVFTIALVQGVTIAILGGGLGMVLTPVAATGIEHVTASVTGFEGLVAVPIEAYFVAGGIVVLFGLIGTLVAVWRVSREDALSTLAS